MATTAAHSAAPAAASPSSSPGGGTAAVCVPCDDAPDEADTVGVATALKAKRGCAHYSRGCLLRAPCCDQLYSCRYALPWKRGGAACPVLPSSIKLSLNRARCGFLLFL